MEDTCTCMVQWNLHDITKSQWPGKICLLKQGFVVLRFFSMHFTIAVARNIGVIPKTLSYISTGLFNQGSTV